MRKEEDPSRCTAGVLEADEYRSARVDVDHGGSGGSALQGENTRPPRQLVVGAARGGGLPLVEELQVAGVYGHGLVGVVADQVTVADVVGPVGTAVGLAREGVALAGGLRG